MAALTLTSGSAILKTFYLPPLQRLFNKQTILWDRVERNDKWNPEGKSFTLALHYGRHPNAGVGQPSTAGTLPRAGTQAYSNSIVPTAYLYTRIQVEGPIIEHAKSNAGSFVRAVRSEVEGAAESFRKSMNRQANGDGIDELGFIQANANSASQTVVDFFGNHNTYLQPGVATPVEIYAGDVSNVSPTLTVGAARNASTITATAGADGTNGIAVTLSTSQNLTAGDIIVPSGGQAGDVTATYTTLGRQMTGLRAIIAATDPSAQSLASAGLQGLAVASNAYWTSQIVGTQSIFGASTGKQDLRFPLLQRVISKVAKNSPNGKDDIKFVLASFAGQDTYYELAMNERIAVNTMVLDGGFEGLEFAGIPIVADPEHWDGVYDFIVPDALRINQVKDVDWMDKDGNVLFRVSGSDAYEATLYAYMNLGTTMRNSLGALVGINMS
jgi:hypothetical protein